MVMVVVRRAMKVVATMALGVWQYERWRGPFSLW
jgi:hypothetical protein